MIARNVEGEFDTVKDDLAKLRDDIANLSNALKDVTSDAVKRPDRADPHPHRRHHRRSQAARPRHAGRADRANRRAAAASVLIAFGVGLVAGRLLDR